MGYGQPTNSFCFYIILLWCFILLSLRRLKDVLDYSPDTGLFVWKSREGLTTFNSRFSGKVAGNINVQGYVQIQIDGKNYLAHRLAWFISNGEWPVIIDHLNGNPEDNRLSNLRSTDSVGNARNVVRNLEDKCIRLMENGRYRVVVSCKHIGCYDTKEEAKIARDAVFVFGGFSERHKEEG